MKYGDLISRQDFDKCLEDAEKEAVKNRKYVFASALNTIRGNLRNFPSAQSEIIRCKDCKFWKAYGYINGKPEFLPKCGFNQIYTNKDDFCSRAERKGNERPD